MQTSYPSRQQHADGPELMLQADDTRCQDQQEDAGEDTYYRHANRQHVIEEMQWIGLNIGLSIWRGRFDDVGQNHDPQEQHQHNPRCPLAPDLEELTAHGTKEARLGLM